MITGLLITFLESQLEGWLVAIVVAGANLQDDQRCVIVLYGANEAGDAQAGDAQADRANNA
jgi:hypothetical protein